MPLSAKGVKLILVSSMLMIGCSLSANYAETPTSTDKEADAEARSITRACPDSETLYFSCKTSSGRHVSICGRNKESLDLTYRHNEGGYITLAHHWNSASGPDGRFTQNAYLRYRTEYNEIGFALADKEYKVFSHYNAEDGPGTFSRGFESKTWKRAKKSDRSDARTPMSIKSISSSRFSSVIRIAP